MIWAKFFISVFTAILFLQSGLDKVFDYKGNRAWLEGHFAKSPLAGVLPLLLPILTILEVATGVCATFAAIQVWLGAPQWGFYAQLLACMCLLALFFGQRLAKDYGGAAGIVPYFILALLGICIFQLPL